MKSVARLKSTLVLLAVFLVLWFLLFTSETPAWDATFYYAYARSVVFDHDLYLENDLVYSYPSTAPDFAAKRLDAVRTITGRVATPFAVGSALLWIPWLAILRGIAEIGSLLGFGPETWTGYEWPFVSGLNMLSALSGLLGAWLAFQVARREVKTASALVAAVTILFSAPLLYYQFREPLYSHSSSVLVTGACVYVWWTRHKSPPALDHSIILGGLIGLASLVRWQHIIYLFLPLISTIWWWVSSERSGREQWKQPAMYLGAVGCAALAVFSIQLAMWKVFFGHWITVPQGQSFMDWTAPFLQQTLFSTYRGLLPWMPITFFSVLGLCMMGKKRPRLAVPLMAVLLLEIYVNASSRDWFGGGGFGPRRFISELPIFLVGYAGFLHAFSGRVRVIVGCLLGFGLSIQQWILLRFALVERIGGHNISMAPDYLWKEAGYRAFLQQITAHLPDAAHHPLAFFTLPGTLFDGLRTPRVIEYVVALLATTAFVALTLMAAKLLVKKLPPQLAVRQSSLAIVLAMIAAVNLWILVWA